MTGSIAWRWHWPHVDVTLPVSTAAAEVMSSSRQRWWGNERGGQLFVDPNQAEGLILALATPPHPSDAAGRHWLTLDPARCMDEIKAANSCGLRLVGYWHTHPQRTPSLSPKDLSSFSKFANDHRDELPRPIAVVVGTSLEPLGIRAWALSTDSWVEAEFLS